jgi:hypothetical protein
MVGRAGFETHVLWSVGAHRGTKSLIFGADMPLCAPAFPLTVPESVPEPVAISTHPLGGTCSENSVGALKAMQWEYRAATTRLETQTLQSVSPHQCRHHEDQLALRRRQAEWLHQEMTAPPVSANFVDGMLALPATLQCLG